MTRDTKITLWVIGGCIGIVAWSFLTVWLYRGYLFIFRITSEYDPYFVNTNIQLYTDFAKKVKSNPIRCYRGCNKYTEGKMDCYYSNDCSDFMSTGDWQLMHSLRIKYFDDVGKGVAIHTWYEPHRSRGTYYIYLQDHGYKKGFFALYDDSVNQGKVVDVINKDWILIEPFDSPG